LHAYLRRITWIIFTISIVTAFWGSFEFAYTLWEHGLISSPIWSGTIGYPVPHHYILGFIGAGISITAIEWRSRRERRHKTTAN